MAKNFEDMYNRLHTIPACDGQTDRRADGQTDTCILSRHSPRYAYASRGKNDCSPCCRHETFRRDRAIALGWRH